MMTATMGNTDEEKKIWSLLDGVPDPEIPVLSVIDLGIVRSVIIQEPGKVAAITITPTYSGCPAMDMIAMQIRMNILSLGYQKVDIHMDLSPAWTTDWMSAEGKEKLKAYGIAPPGATQKNGLELFAQRPAVQCPLCNSLQTTLLAEFGSTACKSLYRCDNCGEPFDAFKCH